MNKKFAIVVSEFNHDITHELLRGANERLLERGVKTENIKVLKVPGAVEIPLTVQLLAKTTRYDAIIALGSVIRGDTNHYDYVCDQVSQGCQRVMLDFELPVIFGVLTTENFQQAKDRVGGKIGHKGREAADAAIRMLTVMEEIG